MMNQEGFWYAVGRAFYKAFELLEWTYDTLSPNKVLIAVGFVAFFAWKKMQNDYNKKAAKDGTIK
jgi:hypothetical protein